MNEVVRAKPAGAGLRRVLIFSVLAAVAGVLAGSVASDGRPPTARAKAEAAVPEEPPAVDSPPGASGEAGAAAPALGLRREPPAGASAPAMPGLAPAFDGLGTVTVFLVALLAATLLLVKRGAKTGPKNGQVRVVDTVPLGGRRLIHLVRCGDRRYLIGNSERGIHFLASVDPVLETEEPAPARAPEEDREGEPTFDDVFRAFGAAAR
ncbi:MAG: flagellar biosynthetic protein FliO [Planctomycetota bacterium JB042]